MPERIPTYRVDERLLREKLQACKVESDPAKCELIEQEAANIRYKKAVNIPEINLRIAVPAALAVILIVVVALNFDSITGMFKPAEESAQPVQQNVEPAPVTVAPVSPPVTDTASGLTPPAEPSVTITSPEVKPAGKKTEPPPTAKEADTAAPETTAKKGEPVIAQPPSDSAARISGEGPQDTAVRKAEEPEKKKKKRRRRRNRDMEELKESTLEPSSADDSVIVPE